MNKEQLLKTLNCDDKASEGLLYNYEEKFKNFLVPKVSLILNTPFLVSILTWLTALWSALVVVCFYFGATEPFYFWFVPVLVIFQYITDTLDGSVGRKTNSGLIRWGYYTDHFLDFVFMTSMIAGYGIILGFSLWIFIIYSVLCAFMIHTFLLVSANNTFKISFFKIGPTEGRLMFIIFHIFFILKGTSVIENLMPYVSLLSIFLLLISFLKSQNDLWKIDLENKNYK